jgi:hypothetical protein
MKHDDDLISIEDLPELQVVEVERTDRLSELRSVVPLDPSAVDQASKKADWSVN